MIPANPSPYVTRVTTVAVTCVVIVGIALFGTVRAIVGRWPLDGAFMVGTALLYVAGSSIIVARVGIHHQHDRFGLANTLTTCRLALTSLFAGLALEIAVAPVELTAAATWFFFAVAAAALIIDGLDGIAARRQGLESAFGSRFDMEVDALLILFMAIAAHAFGKAGVWVLASGALRFFYLLAGVLWPRFSRALAFSWRRKAISAIQSLALAALMAPIVTPPLSVIVAALALGLLIYSFAVDVVW